MLKKKSNSTCYHFVREAVAMKECLVCHIPTCNNVADSLTKVLFGSKRRELISAVLGDVYTNKLSFFMPNLRGQIFK